MRYLFAVVPLMFPTLCGPKHQSYSYAGRGFINPPTIAEMAEQQQEKCLATMIYGEARGEKEHGMIAVAYSAVNRAKNKPVCDIVLAPKQYSIFNNNVTLRKVALSLDAEPKQKNIIDNKGWKSAKRIAKLVIHKDVPDPTKGATHYLAPALMAKGGYIYPKWAKEYAVVAVIDNHKFYKRKV